MNPVALTRFLDTLVRNQVKLSTMIWGPPGIGKSSIVAQTAQAHNLSFIDLRISQLAPTDLRGLPVAQDGLARWFPPEFLPRSGAGVLFLDEINLAPPTMQGMAQQLILDRRVGSYEVPEGWFIWAAGNRQEDRAATFEMPAPLANRFLHVDVAPDFASFKAYALSFGIHEQILAFLAFRPALLHKLDVQHPAWPSPRSWAMASELHRIGLPVESAVGPATTAEFEAFLALYAQLPDLARILSGEGAAIAFPEEPSARYAVTTGLALRAADAQAAYHALRWITEAADAEWGQLCATDLFRMLRAQQQWRPFQQLVAADAALQERLAAYEQLAER